MNVSENARVGLLQIMQIASQAIDAAGGDIARDEEYTDIRLGMSVISQLAVAITEAQDEE